MATKTNLSLVLQAVDKASWPITKLANKSSTSMKKVKRDTKSASDSFSGLKSSIMQAVWAYLGFQTFKGIVSLTSQVEQAQISFETLLWSQEASLQMLRDIDEFAAKTPFNKLGLTKSIQQLVGFGFEWERSLAIMQVLGDSISAVGRWQEELQGVVLALWQIEAKWKLSTEEVLQMAERWLPVYKILEEQLGLTKEQMGDLWRQGIDSATAINAILTWLNEKFNWAMDKQSRTLAWMWSNLVDNVELIWAKVGWQIQGTLKDILWDMLSFLDTNMASIIDFWADTLTFIVDMAKSTWVVFGSLIDSITQAFWILTGEQANNAGESMQIWKKLFMFIGLGFQSVAMIVNTGVRTIFGTIKAVGTALWWFIGHTWNFMKGLIKTMANWIIWGINNIINAVNKVVTFLWWGALLTPLEEFSTRAEEIALQQGKVWENTKEAFDFEGIAKSNQKIMGNMINTINAYETSVTSTGKNTVSVFDKIWGTLNDIKWSFDKVWGASGEAWKSGWKAGTELKEAMKTAEKSVDSVKKTIEKTKTGIEKTREKIKDLSQDFIDFKTDWARAILDVNREISNLKKSAEQINIDFDTQKAQWLTDRLFALEWSKVDIEGNIRDEEDSAEKKKLKQELRDIEKEIALIKENASESVIEEARAYYELSDTAKLLKDIEKERGIALEENKKKTAEMLEKRALLELQSNQNWVNDRKIQIQEEEWLLKAFYENKKWELVEVKNYENVLLAEEINQKQNHYQTQTALLTGELQNQYALQAEQTENLKALYTEYNDYLEEDTKSTALSMVSSLAKVEAKLKKIIALRASAGMSTGSSTSTSWARYSGWPVKAWQTYLVWEWGTEYFTPETDGHITSNRSMWGWDININLGWVSVRNDNDIYALTESIKTALIEELRMNKNFWIA